MASTIKSVTKYPGIGGEFLEIYKSPSAGNGSVITDILESYSGQGLYNRLDTLARNNAAGVNSATVYSNYPAVIGIKRNGSLGIDIISGNVEDTILNNLPSRNIIKNKLMLNPGDSIVANSRGGYPIRPVLTNRFLSDADVACDFLLSNSNASIIVSYKNGVAHTSTDKARTWTRVVVNSALTSTQLGAFFKGFFYIYHPNNTLAYKSADGITWTQFAISSSLPFSNINKRGNMVVDGTTKMYAVVNSTNIYYTTDGITWTNTNITSPTPIVGMLFSDDAIYTFTAEASSASRGRVYNKTTYIYFTPFTSDAVHEPGYNRHWKIGKLLFYTTITTNYLNSTIRYMVAGTYTVNGSSLPVNDSSSQITIPLPNGLIVRETGNVWYYYRLTPDKEGLMPKVILPNRIFFTSDSLTLPSITGDGSGSAGNNVYLITPEYTLFSNGSGVLFETADALDNICHGTAITVSAIET